jgi:hypothetical protein
MIDPASDLQGWDGLGLAASVLSTSCVRDMLCDRLKTGGPEFAAPA